AAVGPSSVGQRLAIDASDVLVDRGDRLLAALLGALARGLLAGLLGGGLLRVELLLGHRCSPELELREPAGHRARPGPSRSAERSGAGRSGLAVPRRKR